ncbi:tRNA (guanosine(37)-N1)-methyltransferase TrmD [Sinimarinibacterium sp. NLF-5-8]|uniref:tRNA (guanosine(37)-N1)-methyltransferase TrmD n=1 Tax=Sinimarinibacterium sp. NLF-5-8 TaxID=2698684 RepID=UPI00137BECC6|nr:tRNA (guanosine(37)-N1)-methyltransferase TrmD [Sinimarinibacterium sp. NLF-5-8]QHS11174.1 tRNA (guanosine(37)-N1)-methyltransferase TrmD [Sinimarinibacterium sp. NLF-5-8]
MQIEVITLFPELVQQVVQHGMPRIAVQGGQLQLQTRDLRNSSQNRWRRVDDRPYGGGPGMVIEPEPLAQAIAEAKAAQPNARVVFMSPQGERFSQPWAQRLAQESALILLCGRYEALDERAVRSQVDLELSLGDFVISGGELAAMVVIDAIARLLPGVLGDAASAQSDSFSAGLLDHPHYTRPETWRGQPVPEVLMSGDHARIARWRLQQALGQTWLKRPDLLDGLALEDDVRMLLREFIAEQQIVE